MKLNGVELVQVDLPFRHAIGTAAGVHRVRPLLFVRVVTEEAEGWGECAALAEGTAVDPALAAVEQAAVDLGVRRLFEATATRRGELPTAAGVAQLFGGTPVDRMLAATFEMAVADAELRLAGRSLASDLGVTEGFEALAVGAVVGIPDGHDVGVLRRDVENVVRGGAARVRLKIEPGWEVTPVRAVRADHPDLVLQVDANGSFSAGDEDVAVLSRLAEFDVLCIEQPLPPADLVAHAILARLLPVPICLDESLSTPRRVSDALRNGSCAMACLKPARLGGLRATRAAQAACAAAGVPVFVGGFFEAGLGRSSNLALAARLSQDATGLVSDVGDPAEYLAVDPCGYPAVRAGWVRVPVGPGVGNPPESPVLERLEARRRWFAATYT
ncbi:MAG TPA: enolase C-terminal domain-like protein [Acidimicrobiales bacterium]|jgi:O-succinylbenzoate synthase|nr:enolase C-terminal domain-like protein [Acidimicrobiales bacterium]